MNVAFSVLRHISVHVVIPTAVKRARSLQRASPGPQARRFCAIGVGVG
jgi:hypothetical protein